MSDAVKAVICGTQKSFRKTQFCIPLTTQIVNDAGDIASIIDEDSTLVRFIILFLDLLHQNVDSILTELSSRNNVIVTLILDNPINDLTINQRNVLRISKHLITYSTTSYAIRAYESRAKELSKGQEGLATVLEGEADRLRQWLIKYNKVMACHILIIPLNTTYRSLISFQLDLIELCKSLGINKEIIVCTIYDYIGLEESNPDELQDSSFLFQREHRRAVCQLMQELAPIRIYLVGNEARITNYWSRLLIPKELDNGRENVFKYTGACTFMEYEPVNPNIRNNVPGYLGCIWQVTKTIPIKLRDIAEDPDFKIALERVHDTLQKRENDANVKLYHNYMDYHENTVVYSNELHLIEQPGQCSKDPDENTSETIDSSIQHNYQSSSTNT